jgi:glycine/D-amino acid oxidase-like deaminating enzyme
MHETANNARPIKTATQEPMNWQAQAGFVVIGSGAAGLMAALSASEAGKSVILLGSKRLAGPQPRVAAATARLRWLVP